MKIADITYRLTGFTLVREFSLRVDAHTGEYRLQLVLVDSEGDGARSITARFESVARLSIKEFGGGWTQLLYLAIEDVSALQHDREQFRVSDSRTKG